MTVGNPINALAPVRVEAHDAAAPENGEVARHDRLREIQPRHDVGHRQGVLPQGVQDLQAHRVRQALQQIGSGAQLDGS